MHICRMQIDRWEVLLWDMHSIIPQRTLFAQYLDSQRRSETLIYEYQTWTEISLKNWNESTVDRRGTYLKYSEFPIENG